MLTQHHQLALHLGQHGLNIQEFCKQFNDRTKDNEKGLAIPVVINVYKDQVFDFIVKSTPASVLIKKGSGVFKKVAQLLKVKGWQNNKKTN